MKPASRLFTLAVFGVLAAGAQAAPQHSVDLATGRVDGSRILGRTIAGVTAALGRPDFRVGPQSRYRIGWGDRSNFSIEVIFHKSGAVERAWSISFERGPIRDAKLGDLLTHNSRSLQASILARYGHAFKLARPYACTAGNCVGEFAPRTGAHLHLTFGTHAKLGTWVTLWQAAPGT
jgi:hypothetical protein